MPESVAELDALPEQIREAVADFGRHFGALELGQYVLTISGSSSKGTWGPHSDLDFRLYLQDALPDDVSQQVMTVYEELTNTWRAKGVNVDEIGTDGRIAWIENWINRWQAGEIDPIHLVWTIWGYHPMADIQRMVGVAGDIALPQSWRERATLYPDIVQQHVYERFRPDLEYWTQDYHYRFKALRGDVVFLHGLTAKLVNAIAQLLFACNRRWFTGDGNLLRNMSELEILPSNFAERVTAILYPAPGDEMLVREREELCALATETLDLLS